MHAHIPSCLYHYFLAATRHIYKCAGILFVVTVQQVKMLNTSLCVDNEYSFVCLCEFNEFQVAKKTKGAAETVKEPLGLPGRCMLQM